MKKKMRGQNAAVENFDIDEAQGEQYDRELRGFHLRNGGWRGEGWNQISWRRRKRQEQQEQLRQMEKERLSQVGEIKVVTKRATFLKKETRRGGGASFDRYALNDALPSSPANMTLNCVVRRNGLPVWTSAGVHMCSTNFQQANKKDANVPNEF